MIIDKQGYESISDELKKIGYSIEEWVSKSRIVNNSSLRQGNVDNIDGSIKEFENTRIQFAKTNIPLFIALASMWDDGDGIYHKGERFKFNYDNLTHIVNGFNGFKIGKDGTRKCTFKH